MSGVNWQLGLTGDIAGGAMAAFEKGREQRKQAETRNAMMAYAQNPNDAQAMNALLPYMEPQQAFQMVQQRQKAAQDAELQQQDRAREQMGTVANLLGAVKKNPALWPQALAKAQELGIPIQGAPQTFDPQWLDDSLQVASLFVEQPKVMSTIAKELVDMGMDPNSLDFAKAMSQRIRARDSQLISPQPGGGVARYNPTTGEVEYVILPNPGGMAAGAPAGSGGDDDEWEVVGPGGGVGNGTGNFPR